MTQDTNHKNAFKIYNRRYLGAKTKLIPFISNVVKKECKKAQTFADIFAGTGVVANHFSQTYEVVVNDLLSSNFHIYQTWFGTSKVSYKKIEEIIIKANISCQNKENYFSKNFSNNYFSKKNALKIGEFRENIENQFKSKLISAREKSILITSLIYAADKVANTCGHYDAFRKKIDKDNEIVFLLPDYNKENIKNVEIYNENANSLVRKINCDIVYLDPPYNSRQYSDAYHLLENLSEWNKPELFGIAKKMKDRSHIKSNYCTKSAPFALADLVENITAKYIVISYNNMEKRGNNRSHAKISQEEIMSILSKKGTVKIFEENYKQFTTGKTNIEEHKELLYVCKI